MAVIKIIKMDTNLEYKRKYNDFVSKRLPLRWFINMHTAYIGNKPTEDEMDQYNLNVDRFAKADILPYSFPNENAPVKGGNIELKVANYFLDDNDEEFLALLEDDEPIFEEDDED